MSMDNDITSGFFNVGTNTSITILELAKNIIEYSKLDMEPIFEPALKGDVHGTIANIDLIRKEIGWKPSIMLIDWVKDIISSKKFNEI